MKYITRPLKLTLCASVLSLFSVWPAWTQAQVERSEPTDSAPKVEAQLALRKGLLINQTQLQQMLHTPERIEDSNLKLKKKDVLLAYQDLEPLEIQHSRKNVVFAFKGIRKFKVSVYFKPGEITRYLEHQKDPFVLACQYHHLGYKLLEVKHCELGQLGQ